MPYFMNMSIQPNSPEYNIIVALTITLLVVKLIISLYLGKKMIERKKETGKISYGFISSLFVLLICLFISRLFYFQFDFISTQMDPTTYHIFPNYIPWKIAAVVSAFGYANFIFIIDRKILGFKLKGFITYIIILVSIIIILMPVQSSADFDTISLLFLPINGAAIVIPIVFFYIGYKKEEWRSPAYLMAISVILYAIGANVLNESILTAIDSAGSYIRVVMFLISLSLKTIGLVIIAYSTTQFVQKFS